VDQSSCAAREPIYIEHEQQKHQHTSPVLAMLTHCLPRPATAEKRNKRLKVGRLCPPV
jgi:hypothetical protein